MKAIPIDFEVKVALLFYRHLVYSSTKIDNSLSYDNFILVQTESNCRQQSNFDSEIRIALWNGRKHCGKTRKCRLPVFSNNVYPITTQCCIFMH